VESIGIDNAKVKRTITAKPPTTIEVKEILTKKGKNTIRAVVKYEFKDNIMPAINNTLSFDVDVH
jgi:cyanate lyase